MKHCIRPYRFCLRYYLRIFNNVAIRRTSLRPAVEHGNFNGINNVDEATLIGSRALRSCTDYDNRGDGILVVRPGQTSVYSQASHSIWSNKTKTLCLYRTGSNLMRLNPDESSTVIASGFIGDRMVFRDGDGGQVFLTDGTAIGMVTGSGTAYQDMRSIAPLDHFKDSAVAGISIEFWHGMLFIIIGNKAFYSDPYMPSQFDLDNNVLSFSGPITLFRGMNGGIWVADGKLWFLYGGHPSAGMPKTMKADYNGIPGTDVIIPGSIVGNQPTEGMTLWFGSEKGVCVGRDDGGFKNTTEKKYGGSFGQTGSGLFRHDLKYNRFVMVGKG